MKERPILFCAPMILALLAGRKIQTRRAMKLQPDGTWAKNSKKGYSEVVWMPEYAPGEPWWNLGGINGGNKCPYGVPGDQLWVRETFCIESTYEYHGDQPVPTDGRPIEKYETHWLIPHYRATEPEPNIVPYRCDADDDRTRWTPNIFMPRWASRITLEITGVRAERLQEISEADAKAEGVSSVAEYIELWKSINKSWEPATWVWVIEFKGVE